jgi:hypothetical protein
MTTFGKSFASDAEVESRRAVYEDNVAFINEHNAKYARGESGYFLGVNEFASFSHEEFKALYIGPKVDGHQNNDTWYTLSGAAPTSIDWRAKGAVTPVKNQGQCGSCWSFSTTGSVEGAVQIASGRLTSLSEQQLMDCSVPEGDHSCQGGLMDYAFEYIEKNGGLDSEQDYPYLARNEACQTAKEARKVSSIKSHQDIPKGNEDALVAAIANGPVSVAIEADQRAFQLYKGGVFDDPTCGKQLDHGVLAVGYSDTYLIIKNSWGATWGMEGYIEFKRGMNLCGVANSASQPSAGSQPAPGPAPPSPPSPAPPSPPSPSGCTGDYPNPASCPGNQCPDKGEAIQIQGVQGSICAPHCGVFAKCPTEGAGSATPQCAIEKPPSKEPSLCALICQPGASPDQCPTGASCKSIQTVGICTYP